MATSSLSDCSRGFAWNNPCRQPLRPATTSPSFYPYQSLKAHQKQVKNRNQLETQLPGREYFSLPATPPRRNEMSGHCFIKSGEGRWEMDGKTVKSPWEKTVHQDENGNKFLPEWYVEPCIKVLSLPSEEERERPDLIPAPLDHSQNMEPYTHDSSYDEDYDYSDESRLADLEDCPTVNPDSDEISKLNSLGQGQSRFMSLFHCQEEGSSCCSSSSLSDKFEDVVEASLGSAADTVVSNDSLHDCEIADGIEAVRKGLARLLSIPSETNNQQQKPPSDESEALSPLRKSSDNELRAGGSRLLKLFPSSMDQQEDEDYQQQESPLGISTLWKSDSSLANGVNYISSECSSRKNSPNIFTDEGSPPPSNLRVPNITSISPTAPLHFTPMAASHFIEGFPSQSDPISTPQTSSKSYTACDLSTEETEIEAALERGDGFFTNDDHHFSESQPIDDSIWSPTILHSSFMEDAQKLDNISPMTLKQIAENAANDIMDWLDNWFRYRPDSRSREYLMEDFDGAKGMKDVEDEATAHDEEPKIQATALNFYRMFDNEVDDSAIQKILNLAEEDLLSEAGCLEENIFAQLTQSPGILDFLMENDIEEEKEKAESNHLQAQLSGPSLHFLLNSRASDIYNSYLLFPDLMQFTTPMKSFNTAECKNLDESSIFSHLFSSSLDWMGDIDVLDSNPRNTWDQTLQSLSPKTPFTPTGNLSENLQSYEKKHSITLEQLCNLASVATSIESSGIEGSSFLSTDMFVQYLQSQLNCFENIAFFQNPSARNDLVAENASNLYRNKECVRLYRPVPIFPLQFINRLSLTNYANLDARGNQEDLLFSPETHFRPITPRPDDDSSRDTDSSSDQSRRVRVESVPDDVDEELVAIHEGADHSKLVELYAQMQLKQQLAAEQKHNYPQLVTVDESGQGDAENAYEDKHLSRQQSDDVNDYALDCAAEAAATVAVNALGSADPAEALAILEEWHWKETAQEEESVTKTFPDLGYFETAHSFLPSNECISMNESQCALSLSSVLDQEAESPNIPTWSTEDDSSIDQNFEYDSLKKIWIKTNGSERETDTEIDSRQLDFSFTSESTGSFGRGQLLESSDGLEQSSSEFDSTSSWQIILSQRSGPNDSVQKAYKASFPEQDCLDDNDDAGCHNPANYEHQILFGFLNVRNNDQSLAKPG